MFEYAAEVFGTYYMHDFQDGRIWVSSDGTLVHVFGPSSFETVVRDTRLD